MKTALILATIILVVSPALGVLTVRLVIALEDRGAFIAVGVPYLVGCGLAIAAAIGLAQL